jgi:galactitol-specific phosphotransferase system IIC component
MDSIILLPGLIIALLLLVFGWLKILPRLFKLKNDPDNVKKRAQIIQEIIFIGFFCLVFVGIWMIYKPAACIICGIAGLWYFYPRSE